jgi:hypothetical protein
VVSPAPVERVLPPECGKQVELCSAGPSGSEDTSLWTGEGIMLGMCSEIGYTSGAHQDRREVAGLWILCDGGRMNVTGGWILVSGLLCP